MNNSGASLTDSQKEKIVREYEENAEQIIREAFGILMKIHDKVDKADYQKYLDQIKTK